MFAFGQPLDRHAVRTVFSATLGQFDAASCQKTANAVLARAAVDIRAPVVAHRIERRLIRPSDAGQDLSSTVFHTAACTVAVSVTTPSMSKTNAW